MLVLLQGCNICEHLPRDLKSNRKFHGDLDLPSYEQKTDVVNICTDEGSARIK